MAVYCTCPVCTTSTDFSFPSYNPSIHFLCILLYIYSPSLSHFLSLSITSFPPSLPPFLPLFSLPPSLPHSLPPYQEPTEHGDAIDQACCASSRCTLACPKCNLLDKQKYNSNLKINYLSFASTHQVNHR